MKNFILLFMIMGVFFENGYGQNLRFNTFPEIKNITKGGADLEWETNSNCNCQVEFLPESGNSRRETISNKSNFRSSLKGLKPSEFFTVKLSCADQYGFILTHEVPGITASASTGEIKVYFNHAVNNSVSTGTNAIYLNKLVDDTLINYINRATETIDVAIYNSTASTSLSDIAAALNAAYNRGVRVRVVYNYDTQNSLLNNLNAGIKKIASPDSDQTYGIMHNKFVVIDADATNANLSYVWTGSTNWTVSQLNGPDLNNVIIVQDQSLAKAYKKEFEEMWGDTGATPNTTNAKFGPDKTNNTPHTFTIGGKAVECYFSPSDGVNQQIINAVNSAQSDIEFASMVITRYDISGAITSKVSGGVLAIHGLTDDSTGTSQWSSLKSGLLPGRMKSHNGITGIMHHKFMVVDHNETTLDPLVLTGSHNWSTSAETKNDENTLIVHDATIANIYYQAFIQMFSDAGGIVTVKEQSETTFTLSVFPNPASETINIKTGNSEETLLEIMSIEGKLLNRKVFSQSEFKADVSNLPNGIYLLILKSSASKSVSRIAISR